MNRRRDAGSLSRVNSLLNPPIQAQPTMHDIGTVALLAGGTLTALAAAAHLACIVVGAPAYRFMGAGERMARAAEAGRSAPAWITLAIASILFLWSAYAFSGAGVIGRLPLTEIALPVIGCIYLARALGFPLLKAAFPDNSDTFWRLSSGICLVLGLLYLAGVATR